MVTVTTPPENSGPKKSGGGPAIGKMADSAVGSWLHPTWWHALIALPCAIGFVFLAYQSLDYHYAAKRQRVALGEIKKHEPENHNSYVYVFFVSGKEFVGRESPHKDELTVGKQVSVYYDPKNPKKNSLRDFDDVALETSGPTPTLLLAVSAVVIYIWRKRMRLRHHSAQA